ncbi:Unknown protein, partial [Striga hermonthica]
GVTAKSTVLTGQKTECPRALTRACESQQQRTSGGACGRVQRRSQRRSLRLTYVDPITIHLTPIPSTCLAKTFSGKLFVKGLARLSSDAILVISTSPLATISLIRWYLRSMCLLALWARGSLEFATAPLLSQYTIITRGKLGITSKSTKKFLSLTASFAASEAAMYSASIVESATHFCLTLLHEMAPPPKKAGVTAKSTALTGRKTEFPRALTRACESQQQRTSGGACGGCWRRSRRRSLRLVVLVVVVWSLAGF